MNELVQCISLFNSHLAEGNRDIYQELLSGCIAKFPYLALEADQEDAILDLVERAKQRQEQHLEKQIKYNDELKSTITRSIQSLLDSIEEDNKQNQQQIDQNIASVQLF